MHNNQKSEKITFSVQLIKLFFYKRLSIKGLFCERSVDIIVCEVIVVVKCQEQGNQEQEVCSFGQGLELRVHTQE